MRRYEVGDRVRIDIPDRHDPDFEQYHGRSGEVVEVIQDSAGEETGDERDSYIFRLKLDGGAGTADFRWRDLRPAE